MQKQYKLITNSEIFQEAMEHLDQYSVIAYDTETTGLNVRKDIVIGFGFTGAERMGFYLPLVIFDSSDQRLYEYPCEFAPYNEPTKLLLDKLKTKKLVMHNASYDIRISYSSLKYNFLNSLHADTVLMEHTLNEEGPFGLKDLAEKYKVELGFDDQDASNQEQLDLKDSVIANGGKWLKTQKDIYKGDWELIGTYCCADVDMTIRLYNFLSVRLIEENLEQLYYTAEVMKLYKLITIRMESKGIPMDMPRLLDLNSSILATIKELETEVVIALLATEAGQQFAAERLAEEFPVSNKGAFAQEVARYFDLPLPRLESGKYQITKKTLDNLELPFPENEIIGHSVYFLVSGDVQYLQKNEIEEIQKRLLIAKDGTEHIINISSKQQLGRIVFDLMGIEALSKTEKGAGQFNEDFIEHLAEMGMDWSKKLRVYNKLVKIQGSYYQRFIDQQEDGIFYPSFKQHATTSGRYGSDLQQLPRPMEEGDDDPRIVHYINTIRELFIPKKGYVFVDTDYESLEPRVFADDAGDQALIDIFENDLDMYSVVAIMAENITDASADKKAENFLKKIHPDKRQNAKAYALGIRYGMKAGKLAKSLNIEEEEAQKIINNYFKAFPGLKKAMDTFLREAKTKGTVTSKFGRVRHLPEVKAIYKRFTDDILDYKKLGLVSRRTGVSFNEVKDIRKRYNNLLNNALNFPIQSAATSIVNRAMIAMTEVFISEKLDAWVSLQIHDQVVVSCNENCVDRVKEIVQNCMENENKLAMRLIAVPAVGKNLRDAH
jgi:DNA polymerase I-like protein with 3'-5' exonuclease and polymerase domains